MNKVSLFFKEHAAAFVIGAIALISVILVTIVVSLASSGDNHRKIVIDDIRGNAFILKNDGQVSADKRMTLVSGDVLITSSESTVRLAIDKDKYIYVEPETTAYVYFTDQAEKGSIVVNISEGAVTCRLDSKLGNRSVFEVRTPNSVISAAGTVFRTRFDYFDTYNGYPEVKLTEVQCADGQVNVQLYDNDASPVDKLMMLAQKKSARLMTCEGNARYEYLNSDTDLYKLSSDALESLIRISTERNTAYSMSELNGAYQVLLNNDSDTKSETTISTIFPPEEETSSAVSMMTGKTTVSQTDSSETSSEASSLSSSESSSVSSSPSEISVTSPTTAIYTVSTTSSPSLTTAVPSEDTSSVSTDVSSISETSAVTTVPPIKPAETTAATTSETTASESGSGTNNEPQVTKITLPQVTSNTKKTTSVPWWEIVNSAALTNSGNQH